MSVEQTKFPLGSDLYATVKLLLNYPHIDFSSNDVGISLKVEQYEKLVTVSSEMNKKFELGSQQIVQVLEGSMELKDVKSDVIVNVSTTEFDNWVRQLNDIDEAVKQLWSSPECEPRRIVKEELVKKFSLGKRT
jgi:hypothetical protein